MINLVHREFTVDVRLETAWKHLAQVEKWTSWAKHIKRIQLTPSGEVMPETKGTFHLSNGMKSTFQMAEFNPFRSWKWIGLFLWIIVDYDHKFESINGRSTKICFVVDGEGFAVSIIGKLFAKVYNRNLDIAIPNLRAEMNVLK